jgi:hypothetical protein
VAGLIHALAAAERRLGARLLQLVGQLQLCRKPLGRNAEPLPADPPRRPVRRCDLTTTPCLLGQDVDHPLPHELHQVPGELGWILGDLRSLDRHGDRQRGQDLDQRSQDVLGDARLARSADTHEGHSLATAQRIGQRLLAPVTTGHLVERDMKLMELAAQRRRVERVGLLQLRQRLAAHDVGPSAWAWVRHWRNCAGDTTW